MRQDDNFGAPLFEGTKDILFKGGQRLNAFIYLQTAIEGVSSNKLQCDKQLTCGITGLFTTLASGIF